MARRKNVKRIDPRYFLEEQGLTQKELEAIEEGVFDRLRSRFAGAKGAVGAAGKAVGKRASAIRTAAGGGKVPEETPIAGATTGAYGYGKKIKIIDLHKKKIENLLLKFDKPMGKALKDLENDAKKLGLTDSKAVADILVLLGQHREALAMDQRRISKLLGQFLAAASEGEISEE